MPAMVSIIFFPQMLMQKLKNRSVHEEALKNITTGKAIAEDS